MNRPELEQRRLTLVARLQDIELQLGDRNRVDEHGNRMTDAEFWEWRKRAVGARRHVLEELRQVNLALKLAPHDKDGKVVFGERDEMVEDPRCVCCGNPILEFGIVVDVKGRRWHSACALDLLGEVSRRP
jgi:hypothetical protein